MNRFAFIAVFTIVCVTCEPAVARTWTNKDGLKIDAQFVRVDGGNVMLMVESRVVQVPLESLSIADQAYVAGRIEQEAAGRMKPQEQKKSRIWSDDTGQFKVEAELIASDNTMVTLRRADGKEISVPLSRLCKSDQDILRGGMVLGEKGAGPPAVAPFVSAPDQANKTNADHGHPRPGEVLMNSIGMNLAFIPSGEFEMGDADYSTSKPQRVRIATPFYLGVYEVTQEEYERIRGANPSDFSKSGSSSEEIRGEDTSHFPVENVSWHEAVAFCNNLSNTAHEKTAGRVYRLPTAAEWEYACRAGTKTKYCTGDNVRALAEAGWYGAYDNGNTKNRTNRVGQKKANAFGLYDMHGNVSEWCADPVGPASDEWRVVRGGSWNGSDVSCASGFRSQSEPTDRLPWNGFRVACDKR